MDNLFSMLFFSFPFLISCEIHYLNITRGVHHITHSINRGDSLCINITQFPFYIIFDSFPSSLTYYEYASRSPQRYSTRDKVFNSSNYETYRAFEIPYASITFETTRTIDFSFTYALLPGYCQTGTYFSTDNIDSVSMTPKSSGFYKIGNYEDKCFIYPIYTSALHLSVKQMSYDSMDRIFLYHNYSDCTPYAGNISLTYDGPSEEIVPFIRILTNRGKPPSNINIEMSASASKPDVPQVATHIPRGRDIDCEEELKWYSEELVILLAVCCGFLGIILILLIACTVANKKYSNQ